LTLTQPSQVEKFKSGISRPRWLARFDRYPGLIVNLPILAMLPLTKNWSPVK